MAGRIALVLGGADCVWADAEAALDMGEFDGVVGCNAIGRYWPGRMDAWVSLHPEKFGPWCNRREADGLPPHAQRLGLTEVEPRFVGQREPGSSGLFALKVALMDLGFNRAVLCGIPLDTRPHFDSAPLWPAALNYRTAFLQAKPQFKRRARSMSGWTADQLGRPTEEWLRCA
jgi:hypothetical protein